MQINSKLSKLTDKQLLEYKKLYEKGVKSGSRFENRKINQVDLKFAYHVIRLINEVEQILVHQTINLERDREMLKAIRQGEWTPKQIKEWFTNKETSLEKLYIESKLQYSPDEDRIKQLLLDCLEEHYGNLADAVITEDKAVRALNSIRDIVDKYER